MSFLKRPVFYALLFVIVQIVFAGSVIYGRVQKTSQCQEPVGTHTISITARGFKPTEATIPICSEVIFVNEDTLPHRPAFGVYESHNNPRGFTEKVLADRGDTNSFVISEAGVFGFHDHADHEKAGSFTVTP